MKTSEFIDKIAPALLAAQKKLKNIKKTKENPFYHSTYAALDDILDEIRPILNGEGLVILQDISPNGCISTMILHESGQWMQQDGMYLPNEKNSPQGAGSSITYGRRYTLPAMLGFASEEDDDANSLEIKQDYTKIEYQLDNDDAPTRETFAGWKSSMSKEEIREKFGYWKPRDGGGFDWYSIIKDKK